MELCLYMKALMMLNVFQFQAPLRKKVPVRLQLKLKNLSGHPVGLEFIDEFLPTIEDQVEPYYEVKEAR